MKLVCRHGIRALDIRGIDANSLASDRKQFFIFNADDGSRALGYVSLNKVQTPNELLAKGSCVDENTVSTNEDADFIQSLYFLSNELDVLGYKLLLQPGKILHGVDSNGLILNTGFVAFRQVLFGYISELKTSN
jgi:hypothetical protein